MPVTSHRITDFPFGLIKEDFPLYSRALRRAVIRQGRCPKCGGYLDTAKECNECGHDALAELEQEP